jgi:UDP-glucose:(heptosyl)LPS alpha-1,3-glucosyltransferase
MTIAILKKSLAKRGGLENQTFQIAQAFEKRGYSVTCLTSEPLHPDFAALSAKILPLKSVRNFRKVEEFDAQCARYLKENPFPLVFGMERTRHQTHLRLGNGIHRAYLEQLAKFESPWRRLSHLFNPAHNTFLKIEKSALEDPDLQTIIVNSAMVKEDLLRYYAADPAKIQILHNGVDWQGAAAHYSGRPGMAPLDPSKFQFLFVGHNYSRKGLPRLLKAFAQLQGAQLSVVGHDRRLPRPQKNVFFFGAQKNLIPFYQSADALVIPSLYDPFSNVTLEALAMGLFVVSSKHNGGCEVLTEQTGAVIEELSSTDAILAALKKAMAQPKTPVSAAAIRSTIAHLDFPLQLERLLKICHVTETPN